MVAISNHSTMPGPVLGDRICNYQPEINNRARMLMATWFFCRPTLVTTNEEMWSVQPINDEDARGWQRCAKTGMKVPLHAQAYYLGKCYDQRYVPKGPYKPIPDMDPLWGDVYE